MADCTAVSALYPCSRHLSQEPDLNSDRIRPESTPTLVRLDEAGAAGP